MCWHGLTCSPLTDSDSLALAAISPGEPLWSRSDETLRAVADRMVSSGHGVLPVVDDGEPASTVGAREPVRPAAGARARARGGAPPRATAASAGCRRAGSARCFRPASPRDELTVPRHDPHGAAR